MSEYIVIGTIIAAFAVAAVLSYFFTPPVKNFAHKVGAIDVPKDARRMHKKPIPRLGGLAIYGAVIGGALALLVMAKIKKMNALKLLDIGASSIILGQAIGRWGNFMNAEAYGYETELPWRMGIHSFGDAIFVHPTFLYESLWNLLGFFLLWYLYKKKRYDGQIFLLYLAWYGFGRMFIEGLRTDSLWLIPDVIRVSQLLGGLCFAVCGALLVFFEIKFRKKKSIEVKSHGNQN